MSAETRIFRVRLPTCPNNPDQKVASLAREVADLAPAPGQGGFWPGK